jgi:hypothetical protein
MFKFRNFTIFCGESRLRIDRGSLYATIRCRSDKLRAP